MIHETCILLDTDVLFTDKDCTCECFHILVKILSMITKCMIKKRVDICIMYNVLCEKPVEYVVYEKYVEHTELLQTQ